MTLLARDEVDIIDAQIAFHLNAGVDFVVATDHRSQDGTTEILERYQRAGYLHLIREDADDVRQSEWVTCMARLAATEFGADWVINSDADEFWWPRGGSLKDVLATVPERYGVVRGCWRHFLPCPDDGADFAERMIVRLAAPEFPGDKATIFHAHQKVAHRGDPGVTIEDGNHNAEGACLEPLRGWYPLEVLHFSFRSVAQLERKAGGAWMRSAGHEPTLHVVHLADALREGTIDVFFDSFVVSGDDLERGRADGTLEIDTRLRDALRELRDADGAFRSPAGASPPLSFPRPTVRDDAVFAGEASVLAEIDAIVRAEQRIAAFEGRLERLENPLFGRLARRASRG